MTKSTRRRVIACGIAVALTLPIESILLDAISTPDARQAVQEWAADLDQDRLDLAASQIKAYPLMYRKAIMRALGPGARANIWRKHIAEYVDSRPDLDPEAVALLETVLASVTPQLMGDASAADREEIGRIATELSGIIGREETEFVLYRLGPRDNEIARSLEPTSQRLANWVRGVLVALARADDCDCASSWGCDGYGTTCRTGTTCNVDNHWPMCGWLWNDPCDGLCLGGIAG
jgi:hypothetical protein